MQSLIEAYKNSQNLHHAYVIEGEREEVLSSLKNFLENQVKFTTQGNPDFWSNSYETFGIDEARALKSAQSNKALAERKVFILSVQSITHEAQNSLLKIFEEPTAGTHFFIIVDSGEIFIPTLRSRLVFIKNEKKHNREKTGKSFLSQTPSQRLSQVKEIIEEKDGAQAIDFLNSLEHTLAHEFKARKFSKDIIHACDEIIKARMYLRDRSPSVKMILEHLSLTLPTL